MRYHLNIRDAAELIRDEEGGDFATLEAARAEARASVQDLVADDLRCGRPIPERRIEIADERGVVLASVALAVTAD
jgi:hypothetical protein